eukprot:jgi/Mesvir1/1055/Mv17577-RA.1
MDVATRNGKSTASVNYDPASLKADACQMIRTLVVFTTTLNKLPPERVLLMKLYYYDHVTPEDYEPPFFRAVSENDTCAFYSRPLKVEIGKMDGHFFAMSLKVKSTLDPVAEEDISMGNNSVMQAIPADDPDAEDEEEDDEDEDEDTHAESGAAAGDAGAHSDDETCGSVRMDVGPPSGGGDDNEKEIRDFLMARPSTTVDVNDILCEFPGMTIKAVEGIVSKLAQAKVLKAVRGKKDTFEIQKAAATPAPMPPPQGRRKQLTQSNGAPPADDDKDKGRAAAAACEATLQTAMKAVTISGAGTAQQGQGLQGSLPAGTPAAKTRAPAESDRGTIHQTGSARTRSVTRSPSLNPQGSVKPAGGRDKKHGRGGDPMEEDEEGTRMEDTPAKAAGSLMSHVRTTRGGGRARAGVQANGRQAEAKAEPAVKSTASVPVMMSQESLKMQRKMSTVINPIPQKRIRAEA